MKNLVMLFVLAALSSPVFAQKTTKTVEEEVQAIEQEYADTKRGMVDEFMGLEGAQAKSFWKVYDAYEAERKQLAGKKFDLIVDYAANYDAMTAEKADELVNATFAANRAYDDLNQKYYNKMKIELGAVQAARFTQFETYLQGVIQGEIQDQLPFIGDMEKAKKKKK
jgi:hypothetical protein